MSDAPAHPPPSAAASRSTRSGHARMRAAIGGLWPLAALGLLAVLGPLCAHAWFAVDATTQALDQSMQPPSREHLLGTDFFGRDVLVRTLLGLRMSLGVGLGGATLAVAIGTVVGATSGYFGGLLDLALMRLCDVLYALPMLFLAILLVAIFGQSVLLVFVALGLVGWLTSARMVRAHVLSERQRAYVAALRLLGAGHGRILLLHVLPNSRHVIAAAFSLSVPAMVLEEAFLSFLGLGVPPPGASLGALVGDGMQVLRLSPWPLVSPSAAMVLLVWLLYRAAQPAGEAQT